MLIVFSHNPIVLFETLHTPSSGVKSSLCDAWAALIVSVTIFIAIIPLSMEVYSAYCGKRAEGVRAPAH